MSQSEAWIVAALGMTMVCVGLLLCAAFIELFSRVAKRIAWAEGGRAEAAATEPSAMPSEPVPADILAVIAAVVEVERKLYVSRPDARQTPRRPALQS